MQDIIFGNYKNAYIYIYIYIYMERNLLNFTKSKNLDLKIILNY